MDLLGGMLWGYFRTCQGGKITEAERVPRESQWQVASQTRYLCVYLSCVCTYVCLAPVNGFLLCYV